MDPHDLRNIFRQFFGFQDNWRQRNDPFGCPPEGPDEGCDEDGHESHSSNPRGFTMYSDPLEMHKYFDQQMDEMLKMFGFGFGGFSNGGAYGGFDRNDERMIPFQPPCQREDGAREGDARDFMLKDEGQPKVDTEADWNQLDMTDIDKLMKNHNRSSGEENESRLRPYNGGNFMQDDEDKRFKHNPGRFSFQSFGSSMSEKSIRNSNGGVETTTIIRNSDGSETVRVTKQLGDQAHQTVTTRDQHGSVTTEENLVNMTEKDLDQFQRNFAQPQSRPQLEHDPRQDMMRGPMADSVYSKLWDKFFSK